MNKLLLLHRKNFKFFIWLVIDITDRLKSLRSSQAISFFLLFFISSIVNAQRTEEKTVGHPEKGLVQLDGFPGSKENMSLREEHSRTFSNTDGSFSKQQGAMPLHYMENGLWLSFEDKLRQSGNVFQMNKTDLPISIDGISGLTSMKLSQSGAMLFGANTSLKFVNENGQVVSEEWMRSQNQFESSENKVVLKNAWNNIDRKQTVHYWSVETDYVIKQMPAVNIPGGFVHFTENVSLPAGWTIKKGKGIETPQGWEGELIILDENQNYKGNFGKLVFYDGSNKKKSAASGSYAFQQNGTSLILTTIVPADWLMAAERVFPVVIDPTVSNTKAQYGNVYHDNSYGCSESLVVNVPAGTISGTTTTYRITAYEDFWDGGWKSEQRSRVGCGANWSAEQSGSGNATGEQSYSITGMTIADQVWAGGNLTFTWQAKSTYSIEAGCFTDYQARTNNWVVTVTYTSCTTPTAYTVNGGGTCQAAAVAVGLSGSQTGVNYQLKIGGVNTGSPVAGTGSAISFGNQGAGVYTVEASGSGYCTVAMTGSTTVSMSTFAPGSTSATLNPVCSGTSFTVSIGAIAGATYQWQSSTDGSTYTNISGATSNTAGVSLTANTYYRCNVTYCSNTIASDPLFVSLASCFTYTGADQTYVAPDVSCLKVYLWGAGGGGGDNTNSAVTRGGGGGYVEGTLSVSSGENLKIITGQAGQYGTGARVDTYGGGGRGGGQGRNSTYGSDFTGSGGGRSAIRRLSNVEVATAGGGGGGGESPSSGNRGGYGGAGGGTTGQDGYNTVTTTGTAGGRGGTPSAGGAAGAGSAGLVPTAGSAYQGGYGGTQNSGTNIREGGGGGGGYFGGGGGAAPGTTGAGGGGGSSYTGGLSNITNTGGSQFNPGNPTHTYNGNAYGAGGTVAAAGQNGRVVVEYAFTKDKGTVTSSGQTLTICSGETVTFTGGGSPQVSFGTLTYTWYIGREISAGAYGDWQVIGSGASITGHNPLATAAPGFPTATKFLYIRRTYSSCGGQCVPDCASQDNNIWVNVVSASGNPATFGTNAWNVYGYNGANTTISSNTYRGYYTQPALGGGNEGIATQNFWSNINSPSYAGTTVDNRNLWNGCPVDVDNHTFVHKRKGFLCGTYTITMQNWDDETRLIVNGVNVWSCGVWSGNSAGYSNTTGATYSCAGTMTFTLQLDANSEVEIQVFEAVGGSNLGVDIIRTAPTALSGSGTSSRTCAASGSAYIDFVDVGGRLIASINPNNNNLGNVTITSYVGSPGATFACNTSNNPLYQTAYMGRNWIISSSAYPGTNFPSAVTVRLPFNDSELTAMNTYATTNTTGNPNDNGATLSNTMLTKFTGTTENNNPSDNCTGGTIRSVLQTGNGNLSAYSISNASYIQFNVAQFSEMFLNKSFGASPLPVTLTSFSAGCNDMEVEIMWTTASEQNSQKFVVERSRDMNSWTTVSELPAAGNSNMSIDYVLTDNNPSGGISYYRLVQIDNDGTEKIYGPLSASCSDQENKMSVFPNPTKGDFTVEISSVEEIHGAEIVVSDLTGKIIATQTINLHEGKNQVMYNGLELQKGTYLVNLVGKGKQFIPVKVAVD